jgi:hypothetical protein
MCWFFLHRRQCKENIIVKKAEVERTEGLIAKQKENSEDMQGLNSRF